MPAWSWAEDTQPRYQLMAAYLAACEAGNTALVSCHPRGLGNPGASVKIQECWGRDQLRGMQ